MNVVAEETNQYDPNVILVVMPDEVDHWLLDEVTRPPPRQQTAEEILGKTVGRVPKKLTDVFCGSDCKWNGDPCQVASNL